MPETHYDALFAGFGASSCLLIHELHLNGWLSGKKIAIVEPSKKDSNDRTFCFWADPNTELVKQYNEVISYSWSQVNFNGNIQSIEPLQYFHIRGLDLYRFTRDLLMNYKVDWFQEKIQSMIREHDLVHCRLSDQTLFATLCFDSRPLFKIPPQFPDVALIQSFYGLRIKLQKPHSEVHYATMMDFHVDQQDSTQFIYRLPYSEDEILIELTRFSEQPIDPETARPILQKWIQVHYGEYQILEMETGAIPMEVRELQPEVLNGVIPLGTRAGKVKPSTGYAFKNMAAHAREIAKGLISSQPIPEPPARSRFRFYDHLLLIILNVWPNYGKRIFNQLLKRVDGKLVLNFLDQQTHVKDEIKIFSKLPLIPFLKALALKEWSLISRCRTELIVLTGALLAAILHLSLPNEAGWVIWPVLLVGLVAVGIPHGALDDLLESNGVFRKLDVWFILRYLLHSAIMLIIWLLNPLIALIIFLLYSAWHFGQADVVESDPNTRSRNTMTNASSYLFQGIATLGVILLADIQELNKVLFHLNIPGLSEDWARWSWMLLGLLLIRAIMVGNRKLFLGALLLLFVIQLPLLMSFGIYFIFHHSIRGWKHIRNQLRTTDIHMFLISLPFHIGAWFLLGLIYWTVTNTEIFSGTGTLVGVFFIFLSSLSFPHVLAMDGFYRRK